jgi:hypothetical protein
MRRDNLCADTDAFLLENNRAGLRKFFLFGSLTDVSLKEPAAAFAPVFRQPGDRQPHPLFSVLEQTAEALKLAADS